MKGYEMKLRSQTVKIIETAIAVLTDYRPMTVRQVYYQLVSLQTIDNNRSQYAAVSKALVWARRNGKIPWEWIEDRIRRPRQVPMWSNLAGFAQSAYRWYRRDIWDMQPDNGYIEVWVEKDALSGIFEEVLSPLGVTLNVGRGYDGWSSINNAAERFGEWEGTTILYFGDFDPSGQDMIRSLEERLNSLGVFPQVVTCALTSDDITTYNLPAAFAKQTDTRYSKFVEQHGDLSCVELDALPINILRERIKSEVTSRMNMAALKRVKVQEEIDKTNLLEALRTIS